MPNNPPIINAAPAAAALQASAGQPAAPAQDGLFSDLAALRAELDRIDNGIHALLIERAHIVEYVARSGKPAAFRPGREAAIIRRLLAQHEGRLPRQTLFGVWRELLAGTTAMQGPFLVAVAADGTSDSLTQLAREHFGALTPLRVLGSAGQALNEVHNGNAAVAVLPFPMGGDQARSPWWTALLRLDQRLYINARLPFWTPRPDGAPNAQALVVASTPPDASGEDRSFLALELDADVSRARIASELGNAGLPPEAIVVSREAGTTEAQVLVEVAGALGEDDPRLAALGRVLRRPVVLGGYAVPVGGTV
ncbi:MAG: chorismate mutase [Acetobacteraceae bacterium]|nr:chorismate mutase [Acetobacteraceae bacterium]